MRFLVRATSWVVIVGLLALLAAAVVATRHGYQLYVVRSGSMIPAFAPGDVVVIGPVGDRVVPGEVVTFQHSSRSDDLVTHRVTEVTSTGVLHTKGDANQTADVWDIRPEQVQGVERFVVPRLGYVIVFLREPRGMAVAICILVAVILALSTLVSARPDSATLIPAPGRHGRVLRPRSPATTTPWHAPMGDLADDSTVHAPPLWISSAPPPGFGRLAQCHYPCVVVEGSARWSGRALAWQRSGADWRAFVRFTRRVDAGPSVTTESWLALSSLEPVRG